MEENWSSIPIKPSTRKKLEENTTKNMTYDEKINALVDFWIRYRNVVNK